MMNELVEGVVRLVKEHIEANINSYIATMNTQKSDGLVLDRIETQSIFDYEKAHGFVQPCLWIIARSIDFMKKEKQSNFIDCRIDLGVHIVCEELSDQNLTKKVYRYCSVIHKLIDNQVLTSNDNKMKLFLVPTSVDFSASEKVSGSYEEVFRKEMVFSVDCYMTEDY